MGKLFHSGERQDRTLMKCRTNLGRLLEDEVIEDKSSRAHLSKGSQEVSRYCIGYQISRPTISNDNNYALDGEIESDESGNVRCF